MFWFKHKSQIAALQARVENLQFQLDALENFVHSDTFHEIVEEKFDEAKFDDLAQEAVERAVENASLTVRF